MAVDQQDLGLIREYLAATASLSQTDAAKQAGISQSTVSTWRNQLGRDGSGKGAISQPLPSTMAKLRDWAKRRRPAIHDEDAFQAGVLYLAARMMDTLRHAVRESIPTDRWNGSEAILREASNRLRELGAAHQATRRPEESERN